MAESRFIVLEGVEGTGLEELAHDLARRLEGHLGPGRVYVTREPSDGPIGRDIRLALTGRLKLSKETLAVLFAADRMDHLTTPDTGIEARLQRGEWVVCDRYYLSHYAFQTYQGFDLQWLRALNRYCRKPDLILYIELPISATLAHYFAEKRKTGYHYSLFPEAEERDRVMQYLTGVQEAYRKVIEQLHDEPIEVIQSDSIENAKRAIWKIGKSRRWF